ncbi:MAG TPA: hypothetical protein VFT87_04550 [Candidatus Saccharimonadales bacterium]|nr:hypothetical protein [Candidatus Saccharimonadales bacterium]
MKPSYWQSQTKQKPLFPDLEWSRPENRLHAGKLLVVGGNAHGFAAPAGAFGYAEEAGAGTVRAILPDAVRKIVGAILPEADYGPSTPSGSFSQKALSELLSASSWSDAVLVAGDLGRNSETAILLESFLKKHRGQVTFTKDAVDYATSAPEAALSRPDTLLVLSLSQLQRLATAAKTSTPIRFSMDLMHLVEWLHHFTTNHKLYIIVKHLDNIVVAAAGQVSSTKNNDTKELWRVRTAAAASVWWMQHPNKEFEALTASLLA